MSKVTEKKAVEPIDQNQPEIIYDSPPSESDDDLWLAHGAKILEDSVPGVRNAASELLKALGMLMTVYLAILGFAKFIPENLEIHNKALFVVPLISWIAAVYYCLRVMKTESVKINLRSPSDIREKTTELLEQKKGNLEIAFVFLIAGIVLAFIMIVFRLQI